MPTGERAPMSITESEQRIANVRLIAPNGLGFGEGGIGIREQIKQGILTESSLRVIHEHLTTDLEAFKKVDADDDGCGDGRPWQKIVKWETNEDGSRTAKYFGRSMLRAKVFGGGLVTAASMMRAISGAPNVSETLDTDRELMAKNLAEIGFHHGAHTDNHAKGESCGCGAIDNYSAITANAIKYKNQINDVLKLLYGNDFTGNQAAIEHTFSTYEALSNSTSYFAGTNGRKSMDHILESGAVVKELYGHHIEETIVLNDIADTTLDQQHFTESVKNKSEERPRVIQAFSVDLWRGKQIAQAVAEIAHKEGMPWNPDETYKIAYADFNIRTLAVAATLTDGSLPVYLHEVSQGTV